MLHIANRDWTNHFDDGFWLSEQSFAKLVADWSAQSEGETTLLQALKSAG